MARLDIDRQNELEPLRMKVAAEAIKRLGYEVTFKGNTTITFIYNGSFVHYFPYSGWASGKTIKPSRGLQNLLKQITP